MAERLCKSVAFSLKPEDIEKLDMVCSALSIRRIDFIRHCIDSNYDSVCKNPTLLDALEELENSRKTLEKLAKELKVSK